MASLNKVILVGNLGQNPESKSTQSGQTLTSMTIATSESWKDPQGNKKEHTEWHKIVAWGKLGDNCFTYLTKGSQVLVEGKLKTSSYDKDGTKIYSTSIVASDVKFLSTPKAATSNPPQFGQQKPDRPQPPKPDINSYQDIPF